MIKTVNVSSSLVLIQDSLVKGYMQKLMKTLSGSYYINWMNYIN